MLLQAAGRGKSRQWWWIRRAATTALAEGLLPLPGALQTFRAVISSSAPILRRCQTHIGLLATLEAKLAVSKGPQMAVLKPPC